MCHNYFDTKSFLRVGDDHRNICLCWWYLILKFAINFWNIESLRWDLMYQVSLRTSDTRTSVYLQTSLVLTSIIVCVLSDLQIPVLFFMYVIPHKDYFVYDLVTFTYFESSRVWCFLKVLVLLLFHGAIRYCREDILSLCSFWSVV